MRYLNKTPKQLIDEIRLASGMTDDEIGERTGISQSTISRLRSGAISDTSSGNWRSLVALHSRNATTKSKKAA